MHHAIREPFQFGSGFSARSLFGKQRLLFVEKFPDPDIALANEVAQFIRRKLSLRNKRCSRLVLCQGAVGSADHLQWVHDAPGKPARYQECHDRHDYRQRDEEVSKPADSARSRARTQPTASRLSPACQPTILRENLSVISARYTKLSRVRRYVM